MPAFSFKPDSSFFRKIALGAEGCRSVRNHLNANGHDMRELERGALGVKLWKEVKRKRVRIPDLVCLRCGLRVECRAKTKPGLTMSDSSDPKRAWDFGMDGTDLVAFPTCRSQTLVAWSSGSLRGPVATWHEREQTELGQTGYINYVRVGKFRKTPHKKTTVKGYEEGSETSITWDGIASTVAGKVEKIVGAKITVKPTSGKRRTRSIPQGVGAVVEVGETVDVNQILAATVNPEKIEELQCPGTLAQGHLQSLLFSTELTQRFTGVKLARLLEKAEYKAQITDMEHDPEEDIYVRLEAAAYLASVVGCQARPLFGPYLAGGNETALEAIIAMGEAATPECSEILSELLLKPDTKFFEKDAASWALGQAGSELECKPLIQAFSDPDVRVRDAALDAISAVGECALPALMEGLQSTDPDIAAGCAEAIRRRETISAEILQAVGELAAKPLEHPWAAWLLASLPTSGCSVPGLESSEIAGAITQFHSFFVSWVARRWEPRSECEHD